MNPRVTKFLLAVAVAVPLLAGSPGCESGRTSGTPPDPTTVHDCMPGFSQPAQALAGTLDQFTAKYGKGWAQRLQPPDDTFPALLALREELATALDQPPARPRSKPQDLPLAPGLGPACDNLTRMLQADRGFHVDPQAPGWLDRPRSDPPWGPAEDLLRAAKEALDM
ncbi:MAG: hypothetical protein HUU06_09495 [Planctomycetaceae bacterium]|nr:hypothetical protein [Planctomycetaceae bacterium]